MLVFLLPPLPFCIIIIVIHTHAQNQPLPVLAAVPPSSVPPHLYLALSFRPWRPHFLFLCEVADVHIICRPPEAFNKMEIIHTRILTFIHRQQQQRELLFSHEHMGAYLFLKTGSLSTQRRSLTDTLQAFGTKKSSCKLFIFYLTVNYTLLNYIIIKINMTT